METEEGFMVKKLWQAPKTAAVLFGAGFLCNLLYGWNIGVECLYLCMVLSFLLGMGCLFWRFLFAVTGAQWANFYTDFLKRMPRVSFISGGVLLMFMLTVDFNQLYPWALGEGSGGSWYLSRSGIIIRLGACFFLLLFLAWGPDFLLKRRELKVGFGKSEEGRKYFRALASLGLPVLFAAMAVWGIDGVMARVSHWHSSLWPVQVIVLSALFALCFFPVRGEETNRNFCRCLLAFVLLHGYLLYSEGMLVWFGRIPAETAYFSDRGAGVLLWGAVLLSCVFPLMGLLFKRLKRRLGFVRGVKMLIGLGLLFELLWRFQPWFDVARSVADKRNGWLESLGMGGLFVIGSLPLLFLYKGMEKKEENR